MTTAFLGRQLDEVTAQRRTITVYADEPHPEIAEHFDGWNVEVRFDRLPTGTADGFATVREGERFLGSLDLQVFDPLLEPPVTTGTESGRDDGGSLDPLLSLLDGTTFRSFDRRQLLAVSREFEDRAWRVGSGRLHAGFQRPSALAPQRDVYAMLADRGLDTHVYFDGTWTRDSIDGVTIHADPDEEIGRFWFVVLATGTDQDCALIARQRDDDEYDGFWTYDPERVAAIDDHLRDRYW